MRKIVVFLLLIWSFGSFAQKDKIKGNREVINRLYTVPPFEKASWGEHLRVKIRPAADTTQIQLRADENLHEVLKWDVTDGVLHLYTSKQIVRKKAFDITLYVPRKFSGLILNEYGRAETDEKLRLDYFEIQLKDRAQANLKLKLKEQFTAMLNDDAKAGLDVEAKKFKMIVSDDATVKGDIFGKELLYTGEKTSDAMPGGTVKDLQVELKNKAEFNAEKLHVTHEARVVLKDKSSAAVRGDGLDLLQMQLNDRNSLDIYGKVNKFRLEVFKGNSVITRHEK